MKDKGSKQHCLPIDWFYPGGKDIFENERTSEKGCVEIEDWVLDFVLEFWENYFLSARTLYTENLPNITFNYMRENSPNYLCHFWNHKSFFMAQLLFIFLAQTLHTFYKSSSSKGKFLGFPLFGWKFTEFFM